MHAIPGINRAAAVWTLGPIGREDLPLTLGASPLVLFGDRVLLVRRGRVPDREKRNQPDRGTNPQREKRPGNLTAVEFARNKPHERGGENPADNCFGPHDRETGVEE